MKFKALLFLIICIAVSICGWIGCRHARTEVAKASSAGRRPPFHLLGKGLEDFVVSEIIPRRASWLTMGTNRVVQDAVIKVETFSGLDSDSAEALVKDGVMGVEALYANALSPYPGDLSKKIVGDDAYQPRLISTNAVSARPFPVILLYANDRLGYGATTKDSVRFKSALTWIYCAEEMRLHRVTMFFPLSTADAELEWRIISLSCPP